MQDIINNIDDLKDIRLYVITPDFFPAMKGFYEHFELNKYNNIAMGFDNTGFFRSYFQVKGVPYIAIYNKNKKLSRVFIGKTDVAVIKDIAAE
jgi:hypothetical protein